MAYRGLAKTLICKLDQTTGFPCVHGRTRLSVIAQRVQHENRTIQNSGMSCMIPVLLYMVLRLRALRARKKLRY